MQNEDLGVYTNMKIAKFYPPDVTEPLLISCLFQLFICGFLTFYFHWVLYYSKDILITVNFVKEVKFSELQGRNMAFKPCNTVKEKSCVEDKIQCSCSFSGF